MTVEQLQTLLNTIAELALMPVDSHDYEARELGGKQAMMLDALHKIAGMAELALARLEE